MLMPKFIWLRLVLIFSLFCHLFRQTSIDYWFIIKCIDYISLNVKIFKGIIGIGALPKPSYIGKEILS